MNQDRDIVKLGKKEYVQTTKINWKAKEDEPLIHLDFSKPKLKGYLNMYASTGAAGKVCEAGKHSNRLIYDPKKKVFRCSVCGRVPKK